MRVTVTQLGDPPAIPSFIRNAVVAAPGGQTGATLLIARVNIVTTGATGNAVRLNAAIGGGRQEVFARFGYDLLVYPATGTAIEGDSANVPSVVRNGGNATFTFNGVDKWLAS